jgi:nucleotide-binding universal stress UspA family protein
VPTPPGRFEIGRDGPGVVVVGLDGSNTSRDALAYAIGMARRERSELVIVSVSPPVSAAAAAAAAGGSSLPPDRHADRRTEMVPASTVEALDDLLPGRWRIVVREGEAGAELERVAGECQADAIVVGRSRNPGRHLLGSVAARLVRHANHPVIVVP